MKKVLADDIEAMHYLLAHAAPDLTTSLVGPVVSLVFLLVLDWRLTLLSVVTVPVFAILYGLMRQGSDSAGPSTSTCEPSPR